MQIVSFLMRRLVLAFVVLICVSILTFVVARIVPSDPAALFAGPRPTVAQIDAARVKLGLDQPLYVQYGRFMSDVVMGDFGTSFKSKRAIATDLKTFFPATLELVLAATILAFVVWVPIGVLASRRPNGVLDQTSRIGAIAGVSIPTFWLAMILQLVFFKWLGWLPLSGRNSNEIALLDPISPVTGFNTIDALLSANWSGFADSVSHLVLPALALAAYPIGLVVRMTRASMVDVLNERHILAARALGFSERTILFRLALKNAISPTLTVLGLTFAFSLTGAFLVEVIFAWPGLGRYVTDAILNLDFPVIMAVTLVATCFYVGVNFIVDLLQALIDPRIEVR